MISRKGELGFSGYEILLRLLSKTSVGAVIIGLVYHRHINAEGVLLFPDDFLLSGMHFPVQSKVLTEVRVCFYFPFL